MAYTELLNNEPRSSFRSKLNTMFSELYSSITSIGVSITNLNNSVTTINTTTTDLNTAINTNSTNIATNTTDITNLKKIGITNVGAGTALSSVTLNTTYTKLTYFNAINVQSGSFTSANIGTQSVTVGSNGVYRIYGNVILTLASTDTISIKLYRNGVAITPEFAIQGLGTSKPIDIGYNTLANLTAGDVLELYAATSASSSVTITGSTVNFEKTLF